MDDAILITALGAVGDGRTRNTAAIQKALDQAGQTAGRVVIPPGVFLTGTLFPRSNTRIEFLPGAVLLGSPDIADYPETATEAYGDRHPYHLLLLKDVHHVTIAGAGTIDGNGPAFWDPPAGGTGAAGKWKRAKDRRPSPMIEVSNCRDIRLQDFTITNSPGWTLHLFCCDRIWVTGVHILNDMFGPNTDGMDISGCRDVYVADCRVECGDDAIVLKTPHDARSCERVVVTNCTLKTNCVALKCGTESHHDFRNITFSNCAVTESSRAFGLYSLDGGIIENVNCSNIVGDTFFGMPLARPIHLDLRRRTPESRMGTIRNITMTNFLMSTTGRILMTAEDGAALEQITLRDIHLHYPEVEDPAPIAPGAGSSQFSNKSPEARPARAAVVADNIRNLAVYNLVTHWPAQGTVPTSAIWARNSTGIIDAPLATGFGGGQAWTLKNSKVRVRE